MAIAMVAMLAFGGTYAYFTATATGATDTLTTAKVMLAADTKVTLTIEEERNLLPGDDVTLTASVTNNSDVKTYVFFKINVESDATLTLAGFSGWNKYTAEGVKNVYYAELDAAADISVNATATFDATGESVDDVKGDLMEEAIVVEIRFASTQFDNVADVNAAYALISDSLDVEAAA